MTSLPILLGLFTLAPLHAAGDPVPPPIINGEAASIDDYPMTGALMLDITADIFGFQMDMRTFICSSTLIAPDVVVLAAHCVDQETLELSITMGMGTATINEMVWTRQADLVDYSAGEVIDWPADAIPVTRAVQHPGFDYNTMELGLAHNSDVALLFLSQTVDGVDHAWLADPEEATQIAAMNPVVLVGWGQQTADRMPPTGTYGVKQMGTSYINELGEWELQAGGAFEDVRQCHGDSGGPVFMDVDTSLESKMRIIGVTSHSYDMSDCRALGGVNTRLDAYVDWLDEQMRAACDDGTRVWCEQEGVLFASGDEFVDTGLEPEDTGEPVVVDTGEPPVDDTGDGTPGDDTATGDDTGDGGEQPTDTGDGAKDDDDKDGCSGCASAEPVAPAALLSWLVLFGLVRRRRTAA